MCIRDRQTHGHGRHGRKWISTPYKDLAFTIIIPNDCNINGQNLVDLACESIVFNLQKLDVEPTIKYPNDIYIKDKKIAGVLCEQIITDKITAPIIGIVINDISVEVTITLAMLSTTLLSEYIEPTK